MNCPDADTFAELLEGRLSATRRHDVERHLDQCAACSNLVIHVAKVYARPSASAPDLSSTLGDGARRDAGAAVDPASLARLTRLQLVAALLHALVSVKLVWLWASSRGSVGQSLFWGAWSDVAAGVGRVAFSYWLIWAPFGALLAFVSGWALKRGVGWAFAVTTLYAVLSLPSVVFLPLSGYVLLELQRLRARRGGRAWN